jgi:ATP-dependent RNA helicase SUPV3L1/SUV3
MVYAAHDPDLQIFGALEARVTGCLGNGGRREKAIILGDALQNSLKAAFLKQGRTAIRKVLLFAYIDEMVDTQRRARGATSSVPDYIDLRYPTEWYPRSNQMQREIHLHVGPTNSGKTYHALKRLEESGGGCYAGPLRLLAHEVYSRFNDKGIQCDLVTGDDLRVSDESNAKFVSCTVEMLDVGRKMEVAVIDEIQMLASRERGWAWTRALLAVQAKEVHLCGETRVISLIQELTATMGDILHIHHYDRLSPLKVMKRSLRGDLKNLRPGDCFVCFSVERIHRMKKELEQETGRRVAVVYGGLPPETRALQAALFNNPENDYDYLVASDAIGMGLNL